MEEYKREYNVLKIREYIKRYYSKSEWNILDIIERLFTHEFYIVEDKALVVLRKYKRKATIYISIIAIDKRLYGTGITNKIIKNIQIEGYTTLEGHVKVDNNHSLNMVHRNGFKIIKRLKYYKDGEAYLVRKTY